MPFRPLLVALLLASLAFAGCVAGTDEATEAAASEPEPSSPAAAPAPPSPGRAPDEAAPEEEGRTATAAGPVQIPIFFEGKLETSASVCAENPSSITCYGVVYGDFVDEHVFEVAGAARSFTVTLSWEALTPLMEELTLTFATSGASGHTVHATATGPSPLTLTLKEPFLLQADAEHSLTVMRPTVGAGPGPFLLFSMDQSFTIEGLLELVPAN